MCGRPVLWYLSGIVLVAGLFAGVALASGIPALSFDELTDHSELVVSGQVTRVWADWDSSHKFIWTHHEISVSGTHKGSVPATVVISEPGGILGNQAMSIDGTPSYRAGDQVLVFLERMPNHYLRTTGWGQGKFVVDSAGRLHADSVPALRALDGMTVSDIHARVTARVAARQQERVR